MCVCLDLCVCHSVPVLRAKAHVVQIRVYVCGCRFVPVLRFKVTEVHFTPKIRAETKKTLKKLISYCNSQGKRCVCECVCSSRALFKGRNAHLTLSRGTGNHRFGLPPNSLTQNEVFITSTHTHTKNSPVAINTKLN